MASIQTPAHWKHIEGLTYDEAVDQVNDGRLSHEDWMMYQLVWRNAMPRFSSIASQYHREWLRTLAEEQRWPRFWKDAEEIWKSLINE